ncbi:MAG: IS200/IS605 family element transposase accessory protein TnpB [Ignavibacteria bacterium]|nr:IS200/IS605 family element transposase accessory protein TnpB [Ignavibacteria bacterium]
MVITRKIELWIAEEDKTKRNETWDFLRMLDKEIFRAANVVVNNQYFNDFYEERIIQQDEKIGDVSKKIRLLYSKLRKANDEEQQSLQNEIEILKEQKKESQTRVRSEFYKTSKQNTTYQILTKQFPEIPSDILTCLNNQIYSVIGKEKKEVLQGKRSIRSYRKGMPIPFRFAQHPRLEFFENEYYLRWLNNISFVLRFGRDKSNNRAILEKIFSKEYKLCDSSIQIDDRKIFLLLVVDIPKSEHNLNKELSVGVDLGLNVPAYCALSEGFARLAIGHKDDFVRVRQQMQRRRKALQKSLVLTSGGKGRTRKLKALDALGEKERHFVRTYNHTVAKRIVEFAEKYNAGVITMELLEGYGKDENGKSRKGDFVLRNWSYFELQTLLKDKAGRKGMDVVFIDPYHTSQTCALCGHYEIGQRETQANFICKNPVCKNFDEKVNADYNAALNIARSKKFVAKKEECEYFKLHKETRS